MEFYSCVSTLLEILEIEKPDALSSRYGKAFEVSTLLEILDSPP